MSTPNSNEATPRSRARVTNPRNGLLRSALGFAAGAVTVAFLLGVIARETRQDSVGDSPPSWSQPTEAQPTGNQPAASSSAHASNPIPPALAGRIEELEKVVSADPGDLESHRQLARVLLDAESWVAAFREAESIERLEAGNADALFVKSVVRLRMGQNRIALDGLRSLVAAYPDHVDGHRALGLALLRTGDAEGAVRAWQRGLSAAGGHDAEIERLLAVSEAARRDRAREASAG